MSKFVKKTLALLVSLIILFAFCSPMLVPILVIKSFAINNLKVIGDVSIIAIIIGYYLIAKKDFKNIIDLFKFKI